ncbi:MAG: XdhC family protein [Acidobacteria bacterium]|nr:XdhC family protein [Acidobacteriota bacterium]
MVLKKEIQEILKKTSNFASDEKAILATVIDVVGSGYRRPGARMLIDENGRGIGAVSGGCLEADVLERAKNVLETNEPIVITYDTTRDENSVFGLSMGCRGIVRILLEPLDAESFLLRVLQIAAECRERQFIGSLVSSNSDFFVGGRAFYNNVEQFDFQNLPNIVEQFAGLTNDCVEFFAENKSAEVREYRIGGKVFEMFFENINPPLNLLLFGAGYDALPLIKFAREIGWRVSVVDHRPAFANAERLSEADEIIVSGAEDLNDYFFQDETAVAVIMTHNYERDREILRWLLHSKCQYIGALGPKKRTERLLEEIGETFGGEHLAKLHAPAGLDIGADTPEAIALAIIAEIQAVLNGREGGFLRERQGSIYDRKKAFPAF